MAVLNALIQVVVPVVLVALVGVALARRFQIDHDTVGKINLYGLTPFLAFDSLLKTSVSSGQATMLIGGYLAVTLVAALITVPFIWRDDGDTRRAVTGSVILGNNGNFGLPIALLALGREGLDQAIVIFLVSVVVMFTVGPVLLGAPSSPLGAVLTVARLPVSWALVAALMIRLTDAPVPVPILRAAELLAGAAVPMVLLALGLQLGHQTRVALSRPVITAVVLRVVMVPLLAAGLGSAIGLSGLVLQSLVLASAMPTAVNVFMIAREFGSDPATTASAVALSTLASIGTIAITVALLPLLA